MAVQVELDPLEAYADNLLQNFEPTPRQHGTTGSQIAPWTQNAGGTSSGATHTFVRDSTSPSGTAMNISTPGGTAFQGVEQLLGTLKPGVYRVSVWLKSVSGNNTVRVSFTGGGIMPDLPLVAGGFVMSTSAYTEVTGNVEVMYEGDHSFYIRFQSTTAGVFRVSRAQIRGPLRRTELDITPWVTETVDWGDAAIEAYMADAKRGNLPVDFRVPNRQIEIPLALQLKSGVSFETIRAQLQSKTARMQEEGGWIGRLTSIGIVYADVVNATLRLGGVGWQENLRSADLGAVLTLETLPEWFTTEVDCGVQAENDRPEMMYLIGATYADAVMSYAPQLYWPLDATLNVNDGSGNGRGGTAGGGISFGTFSPGALLGSAATATDFDGVDDRITAGGYNPFVNGSNRTFAGWAYRDGAGASTDTLFGSNSSTSGNCVLLRLVASSSNVVFSVDGGTGSVTFTSAWPGNDQWVHWALTFNETSNVVELFINGLSMGTQSLATAYNAAPGDLVFGCFTSAGTDPFDGKMAAVATFHRILTAAEVRTLYRAGLAQPPVRGNYPARARLLLHEAGATNQRSAFWATRSRYFDYAANAASTYEAESMTPMEAATLATVSGASGAATNNTVQHASLASVWVPILSTQLAGSLLHMNHVGTYRVLARVRTTASIIAMPYLRLTWDVGDLTLPVSNDQVQIPVTSAFSIVDLGEIRIERVPFGLHRWQGVIEGLGQGNAETVQIDKVWFLSADEATGRLIAETAIGRGLVAYAGRDGFNQTAGALTGKTAPVGGNWTFQGGDTDDYQVDGNGKVTRTAVSDTAARLVSLGTGTLAACVAEVDVKLSTLAETTARLGLFCRFVDTSNVMIVYVRNNSTTTPAWRLHVEPLIAGTPTNFLQLLPGGGLPDGRTWTLPIDVSQVYTLRFYSDIFGNWRVWFDYASALTDDSPPLWYGQASQLATGGAIASGGFGLYDNQSAATAATRSYDNFAAWAPTADAVAFAAQDLEIRYDGNFRDDSAGVSAGPVARSIGDLARLPVGGLETRALELMTKLSRSDLGIIPDDGIDDVTLGVRYRPCWLYVRDV